MFFDFDTAVDRTDKGLGKFEDTSDIMRQRGYLSYTGAEMDYKTAPCIMQALSERALGGIYGSTMRAEKHYLESICWWMQNARSWDIDPSWITTTFGTVHGLHLAIRAFTNEHDGVIIQPPVYPPFFSACKYNERTLLENPLLYDDGHYSIDFEGLEALMAHPEAKLMLLCNPHNPITRVWNEQELTRLIALANKHNIIIFSDEIYGELCFDNHPCVPLAKISGGERCSIVCTSLGKDFNFVGTKHANAIIPNPILRERFIAQCRKEGTLGLSPFMYTAVRAAYTQQGLDWLLSMKDYAYKNILLVHSFFKNNLPAVKVSETQAGCLCWVDWRGLNLSEDELMSFLENECLVQVNEGSHYGEQGRCFTRIAVGTPRDGLIDALQRIKQAAKVRGFIKE